MHPVSLGSGHKILFTSLLLTQQFLCFPLASLTERQERKRFPITRAWKHWVISRLTSLVSRVRLTARLRLSAHAHTHVNICKSQYGGSICAGVSAALSTCSLWRFLPIISLKSDTKSSQMNLSGLYIGVKSSQQTGSDEPKDTRRDTERVSVF